jgi:branched-chain amino acid transport system permease protein
MDASIYILISLGLTLALSIVGIVQLAHGEIYMLGAFGTYYLAVRLGFHYLLALLLATVLVGGIGILIERVIFRPFRRSESFWPSVIMATGLMIILQTFANVVFGTSTKVVTTPFPGTLSAFGAVISYERLIIIGISVVCMLGLILMLQKTRMGQAMIAMSQNIQGATLQGISTNYVAAVTMFIGCGLASVAGGLMGSIFNMSPSMGSPVLIKGIAVIILGGLGSLPGVVVGGLILGFVDSIVPPLLSVEMATLIGFIVIVLILVFRPQGIMGRPSS